MSHSISDSDTAQLSQCPSHLSKRRKLQPVNPETRRTSPPHSHPSRLSNPALQSLHASPESFARTEDVLKNIHPPVSDEPDEKTASIAHWVINCEADTMAPPTPRSGSVSSSRGRRSSKHSARASRTPSPSKRTSPQTYRNQNMSYAGVFIDDLNELPHDIECKVRYILGTESLDNVIGTIEDGSQQATYVKRFLDQSRYHARSCSLEGDWKASLFSLMGDLARDNFQCHTSEKLWNADLKPSPPGVAQPDDESGASTPRFPQPQSVLPNFDSQSASGFPGPVPSLQPYTPSIAYTTSSEAADPFHISTPKPDIVVGLEDRDFAPTHRVRLAKHQSFGSILSDPHTAAMGLRFPFLIAETKGLSLNGGLVAAQNQAAIGAACMLKILDDLESQAALPTGSASPAESPLCFSITTEGPVHELWVHFKLGEATHMHNIRTWRTTRERDVWELVCCLTRILKWAKDDFMVKIQEKLNAVPD
ncbi:hypothetical protein COCMIDRAFT_41912 [Bipolaris oryzae ATCC 44560]|uniref:DUF7924 domain-containing protein n=1 Tax=Bipolaris oryzae ATCC 44560 TaxID=930090 RepID=W6YPY2_COCMI|nr:uncharacterized protein COCMIDRAFT_41912 [Bipolaris oryzae ATCC 44560]EUC39578.1 hypothetical protein COCMIDRAFT_41912 [Bipolaris oryzae ATCC 44560]